MFNNEYVKFTMIVLINKIYTIQFRLFCKSIATNVAKCIDSIALTPPITY